MLLTITIVLILLVAFNFLLLAFSCNKTTKKSFTAPPKVYSTEKNRIIPSNQSLEGQLAPTGS